MKPPNLPCRCVRATGVRYAIVALLLAGGLATAVAQDVAVSAYTDRSEYAPLDTLVVILSVEVPHGWCLYGNPLGPGTGKPLQITPDACSGVEWLFVHKTAARRIDAGPEDWVWGYRRDAQFFLTGVVRPNAVGQLHGTVRLEGLMCRGACQRVDVRTEFRCKVTGGASSSRFAAAPLLRLRYERAEPMELGHHGGLSTEPRATVAAAKASAGPSALPSDTAALRPAQEVAWDYVPVEQAMKLNLFLALLLGFVAGIILNVMPCVLPILGIKVLSLAQGRAMGRHTPLTRSLAFSAGIFTVFMVLASLAAFANFSWGEQFREPRMLSAIICVVVVFALGLFDFYAFSLPSSVSALSASTHRMSGLAGDFVRGMFATIMATPCSGPVLGVVLTWTLSKSIPVIYVVFAAIGLGMASPYVLLSYNRRFMRIIPRPGPWMDDFKHIMAFLLLGVAAYLLVGLQAAMIVCTVGMCLFITLGLAVYRRFSRPGAPPGHRAALAGVVAIMVAGGAYASYGVIYPTISPPQAAQSAHPEVEWRAFGREALEAAHAAGQNAVVDFTASWCMNCQYNKAIVLSNPEIVALLRQKQVVMLKADLTGPNAAAESLLEHLGSRSIPFLAIFRGDDPYNPIVMRDVLSKASLARVLRNLPER
jgi:thiol:disulfide interchange protein